MIFKKKGNYKFSDKIHPARAIFSVILAVVPVGGLVLLPYLSSRTGGNGGLILGAAGMAAMVCSLVGLILGIKSLKQKDIYYSMPIVGTLMNGIFLIIYFVIYIAGIAI